MRQVLIEIQKLSSTVKPPSAESERQFARERIEVYNTQQSNTSIGQNITLEIAQALNHTATEIRKTLESKRSDNRKDYKLSRKSNIDVWME